MRAARIVPTPAEGGFYGVRATLLNVSVEVYPGAQASAAYIELTNNQGPYVRLGVRQPNSDASSRRIFWSGINVDTSQTHYNSDTVAGAVGTTTTFQLSWNDSTNTVTIYVNGVNKASWTLDFTPTKAYTRTNVANAGSQMHGTTLQHEQFTTIQIWTPAQPSPTGGWNAYEGTIEPLIGGNGYLTGVDYSSSTGSSSDTFDVWDTLCV